MQIQEDKQERIDRREERAYQERLGWRLLRKFCIKVKDPLKGLSLDQIWQPKQKGVFD